jgi:hypothetical protein
MSSEFVGVMTREARCNAEGKPLVYLIDRAASDAGRSRSTHWHSLMDETGVCGVLQQKQLGIDHYRETPIRK